MDKFADLGNNIVDKGSAAVKTVYDDASSIASKTTLNPLPAIIIASLVGIILLIMLFFGVMTLQNNRVLVALGGIIVISGFVYFLGSAVLHLTFMIQNPNISAASYAVSMGKDAWSK